MTKKEEKIIKATTDKLFTLLGVTAQFAIEQTEETIEIVLTTEESGMLIGYHGETLEALQLILSLCISQALGKFVRISVEIGDYKKNRIEYLKHLIEQTKEKVILEKKDIALPHLKSWERRIVHMLLQDDQDVASESMGEGRERILTIRPKSQ